MPWCTGGPGPLRAPQPSAREQRPMGAGEKRADDAKKVHLVLEKRPEQVHMELIKYFEVPVSMYTLIILVGIIGFWHIIK